MVWESNTTSSRRLTRRSLLQDAARAGVGVVGLALAGCGGPAIFNEPDAVNEALPRPATTGQVDDEGTEAEDGMNVGRQQMRESDDSSVRVLTVSPTSSGPDHDIVDPFGWRQLYHWRRLTTAANNGLSPRYGGDVTLSTPSPVTWSPIPQGVAAYIYGHQSDVLPLLYSQLIVLSSGDEANAHYPTIEGDLALGWEIADPTTIVFTLRRDVKWASTAQADGRSLQASDVQAMHERYRQLGAPQAATYEAVDQIDADDAAAVITFRLSEPSSAILNQMTASAHVVLPPDWEPDPTEDPTRSSGLRMPPAGTGPFVFRHWGGQGSTWSLTRNLEYFKRDPVTGDRLPYIDSINGGVLASRRARYESLLARDEVWRDWADRRFDGLRLQSPSELSDAFDLFPDAVAQVAAPTPGRAPKLGFLAGGAHPIVDGRVRLALSIALDRQRLGEEWHYGLAAPDCGMNWTFVADDESDWGFREWPWTIEELGGNYEHDAERARLLLDAAGYDSSNPLEIGIDLGRTADTDIFPWPLIPVSRLHSIADQWRSALADSANVELFWQITAWSERRGNLSNQINLPDDRANITAPIQMPRYAGDAEVVDWQQPAAPFASPVPGFDRGPSDDQLQALAELEPMWRAQRRALDPMERSEILESIRRRRDEQLQEIHLVNPYGLHVRHGNVFNLRATFVGHDPMAVSKQLERTWKITDGEDGG